jgi:hypothetical protein
MSPPREWQGSSRATADRPPKTRWASKGVCNHCGGTHAPVDCVGRGAVQCRICHRPQAEHDLADMPCGADAW